MSIVPSMRFAGPVQFDFVACNTYASTQYKTYESYEVRQSVSSDPLPKPSTTSSILAAELAHKSPLPRARRLLKRASSIGHHIAFNPSLPKRRRIREKTGPLIEFISPRPPPVLHSSSSSPSRPTLSLADHVLANDVPAVLLPEVEEEVINLTSGIYAGMTLKDLKSGYVDRNKMRVWFRSGVMKHHRDEVSALISNKRKIPKKIKKKSFGAQLQYAAQKYLTEMPLTALKKLVLKMHADMTGDKHIENRAMLARWMYRKDYRVTLRDADTPKCWLNQRSCLLTWIGSFGLLSKENYELLINQPGGLTEALKSNEVCIGLGDKLETLCESIKEEYHLASYSWSLELCCETLRNEGIIRVHAHAFLEANTKQKMHITNPERLIFEGALPQRRTENVTQATGVQSSSQAACGHYYLRMPKRESIFSGGTKMPRL